MAEIKVPSLGESVTEATVAQWLKKEGEAVEADEPIVELETDKVTLEVNAPEAGTIAKITVQEGGNVEVGAILGEIGSGGAAANANKKDKKKEEAAQAVKQEEPEQEPKTEPTPQKAASNSSLKTSPAVRKLLTEHGLNADQIVPSKGDRITKDDVLKHLESGGSGAAPQSQKSSAPMAPRSTDNTAREERVKMTRLRQSIAKHLKHAQNSAAMLTTFNEVDMSTVMNARKDYQDQFVKKHGIKLGFMSFFVKAAVEALKEFPGVNAEIDGDDIIYKNYYNIGVAVSTPQGLIVPVIRDADQKSMAEIEAEIIEMGQKAKDGKISVDDMQGGTFTITNGGIFGSMLSTPILNAPQSGILGMHNIVQRPVVLPNGNIEARPIMYLAMSYDHRIVDGREAVTSLFRIKQAIEDPKRLLFGV